MRSRSHIRPRRKSAGQRRGIGFYLGGAAVLGAVAGTASVAATPGGTEAIVAAAKPVAVSLGLMRARAPQAGDNWPGCDAARDAGTAPIYAGEPGYREGMDGDGDGIACEPQGGHNSNRRRHSSY